MFDTVRSAKQGLGHITRHTFGLGGNVGGNCVSDHFGETIGVFRDHRAEAIRRVLDQNGNVIRHRSDVTPGPQVETPNEPIA